MQELFLHIEYLLRRHDCVIVPGIGAFLASRRPADFDEEKGLLTPPSRIIGFNASIANNDGMIANSIARRRKIGFEEASEIVLDATTLLRQTLGEGELVRIGRIGSLTQEPDGRMTFQPAPLVQPGMMSLAVRPTLAEIMEDEQPSITENENRDPAFWYFKIRKSTVGIAAACMLIAAIAVTLIFPHELGINIDKASIFPFTTTTVKKSIETKPSAKTMPESPTQQTPQPKKESVEPQTAPTPTHYLIVATFHSERQAQKFIDTTADKDLQIVAGDKVFRVAAAASCDESELRKTMNSPEFSKKYAEAWIWHDKATH